MPPLVYLVRHGEAQNNVGIREEANKTLDALLTDHGKAQCTNLRRQFSDHDKVIAVFSSPLRRAIQSACIAFGPAIKRSDVKYIVTPLAQEISDLPCDIGHSQAELHTQLPALLEGQEIGFDVSKIDLSLVSEGWNSKKGFYAPDDESLKRRAAYLRGWLYQRSESRVVLVTHGAFLHYLTEDWSGDDPSRGTGYLNCEVRIFGWTPGSTAQDAHFVKHGEERQMCVGLKGDGPFHELNCT